MKKDSYLAVSRRRFLSLFPLLGGVVLFRLRPYPQRTGTVRLLHSARQGDLITLPEPTLDGTVSLEQVLAQRRSVRAYTDEALTMEQIGQLLWAAQGLTAPSGKRTAPSAWATYPLDVYVIQDTSSYHYLPAEHALELVMTREDLREALTQAAGGQGFIGVAPVVFVLTCETARVNNREDFGIQELGHAAQNLLLQAVALGLGAIPTGSLRREQMQQLLLLPEGYVPYAVIPVGYPR